VWKTREVIPEQLADGEAIGFNVWPETLIPKGPPGVYTIWDGENFVYVGMSWKEPTATASGTSLGLWGRLNSHASGRRSGDQFCIYICDRFVLGTLTTEAISEIVAGRLSLDHLTREYICGRLSYRFITTATGDQARTIEALIRKTGLHRHGQPLLNPSK